MSLLEILHLADALETSCNIIVIYYILIHAQVSEKGLSTAGKKMAGLCINIAISIIPAWLESASGWCCCLHVMHKSSSSQTLRWAMRKLGESGENNNFTRNHLVLSALSFFSASLPCCQIIFIIYHNCGSFATSLNWTYCSSCGGRVMFHPIYLSICLSTYLPTYLSTYLPT